jgi:hypothetical protein
LEVSRRNAIEPTLPAFLKVTTALHSQEIKSLCKAELLQLNHTQFPSLGFFVSEKVGNWKN